ncbi:Npun_F0494 family protein [Pannus brasiliensis CCIBt3594]|uniref:Npun_F0494 family protein n=1 Tax=Pannus brasiliensis CCIBt3594 TaxID=1427578 RepID=A0AAW9QFM8_9CHRO
MTLSSPPKSSIEYPAATVRRADRALRGSPFRLELFTAMKERGIPLLSIVARSGVESGYTRTPLGEAKVERHLLWLIKVGILRREVDGQGITDSFRLTPLGRQLVEKWQSAGGDLPGLGFWQRILDTLDRWFSVSR